MSILSANSIDRAEWSQLVKTSATGTWFQTPEAYDFYASLPELFHPFVVGVAGNSSVLRAVCVGFATEESNALKQFFTRRAIILGGPCIADDCTEEEVEMLMTGVKQIMNERTNETPIYIETRNFNDYSRWKGAFERAKFAYRPHLNFHVCTNRGWDVVEASIGKHRRKYIRHSLREGATIEENPTIEQVRAFYDILFNLYKTKVKTPLYPWKFFETLYHCPNCIYLLVLYEGKVVGGSICMLLPGRGVYEWYACGKDGEFKNIHPSSLTKYAGMKYACDNGYMVFDMMGAGSPNQKYGVRDFKAEFGGELVEHGRFLCITRPILYKLGELGIMILKKLS